MTFFDVGDEGGDNVCVESLHFSDMALGVGQPLAIRANLRNHGEKAYRDLRIYFRVDGKQQSASEVSLGPGEHAQTLFACRFETPGSHLIEVEVDSADRLKADNVYTAAIPVLDKLPVLLIDGDPASNPLRSETGFLGLALQPFTSARMSLADLLVAESVEVRAFKPEMLNGRKAVVLANVAKLEDDRLKAIEDFVRRGGGLVVFAGNKIDVDWYNQRLVAGGSGMLPLRIDALSGDLNDATRHASIVAQHYEHPSLQLFNDRRNGSLSAGKVRMWYRLSPAEGAAAEPMARLDAVIRFLHKKPSVTAW